MDLVQLNTRMSRPAPAGAPAGTRWILGEDGRVRPARRYDTTVRDQLIVEMRGQGKSLRAIADAAVCSTGTVHRVLARAEAAA